MHPNEPSVEELNKLHRELLSSKSPNGNVSKLSALGIQIKRATGYSAKRKGNQPEEDHPQEEKVPEVKPKEKKTKNI
jgi:hypothetical protein